MKKLIVWCAASLMAVTVATAQSNSSAVSTETAEECFEKGKKYYAEENYTQTVLWLRKAADKGLKEAQYNLGLCYDRGIGVAADPMQAVLWYRKAAEQGIAEAQYSLGFCYQEGKGVTQNLTQAAYWYRKAAEQDNAAAQNKLGTCYKLGNGVTKDLTQAVYWHRKAAEQGYAEAQLDLGFCYEEGEGVTKDPAQAVLWYRKAAKQGESTAQFLLGRCYENGTGVAKDGNTAIYWYEKIIEHKNDFDPDFISACEEIIEKLQKAGYASSRAATLVLLDEARLNFGKMLADKEYTNILRFRNDGSFPIVTNVTTTTNCINAIALDKIIGVGALGEIKVTVKGGCMGIGVFVKTITVSTQTGKHYNLEIRGEIVQEKSGK